MKQYNQMLVDYNGRNLLLIISAKTCIDMLNDC